MDFSQEFLKKFGPEWYLSSLEKQPVDRIREYFGESVGIYFCFVGKLSVVLCRSSAKFNEIQFEIFPVLETFRILHCGPVRARHSRNSSVFYLYEYRSIFLYILCDLADCKYSKDGLCKVTISNGDLYSFSF